MLRALGYEAAALHVNHGLRGEESEADARFCAEALGAEVVRVAPGATEAELRELRYSVSRGTAASDRLRATGHTASDQVETVLYRLVSSGRPTGIRVRREQRWHSYQQTPNSPAIQFRAKANSEKYGFQIVHEATYPLTTEDFVPVIDAAAESGCDLLFSVPTSLTQSGSYEPSTRIHSVQRWSAAP